MQPVFYPLLGARYDLGFARASGWGLGNSFYSYFHALILAQQSGGRLITPPWLSITPGEWLQRDRQIRTYWRIFERPRDELAGAAKLWQLLSRGGKRNRINIVDGVPQACHRSDSLNVVHCKTFNFKGLTEHREMVRARLEDMARSHVRERPSWGRGGYIAVHVRLGDFSAPSSASDLLQGKANTRLPLDWYVGVAQALQERFPDREIRIVSDGSDEDLRPLTAVGATLSRAGSDLQDLLQLASASILVGSNSTYSRWAHFLGEMPSIWLRTQHPIEPGSSSDAPVVYVPATGQTSWLTETVDWD